MLSFILFVGVVGLGYVIYSQCKPKDVITPPKPYAPEPEPIVPPVVDSVPDEPEPPPVPSTIVEPPPAPHTPRSRARRHHLDRGDN